MPYGVPIAILKCDMEKTAHMIPIQQVVQRRIEVRNETEKVVKNCIELRKETAMLRNLGTAKDSVDARRRYLMETYVPDLRRTGMTTTTLHEMFRSGVVYRDRPHEGDGVIESGGVVLFQVLMGTNAFQSIPTEGVLHRQLYVKRGILGKPDKHYVKDDSGWFTRRFAYVEKDWDVLQILLDSMQIQGKDVDSRLGGDPYSKGATARAKYDFSETGDQPRMNRREMAFVNQEDGSTVQRAIAMGSSSRALHGNEGFRFGKPDGVRLKIDLARIPFEGDFTTPSSALFNLYCYAAQNHPTRGTLGLTTYDIRKGARVMEKPKDVEKRLQASSSTSSSSTDAEPRPKLVGTALDSKAHTDWSTSKNREISTLKIPLAAVVEVIFHDQHRFNTEAEEVRLFLRPDAVIAYGPHPGMLPEEFYTKN